MKDMRISRSIIIGVMGWLLLPITAWAEETPPPTPAQPQPPQTHNNTDQTWKEQLEKKHVQFVEWLQANYPEKAADLLAIRTEKPQEFVQQLSEAMKVYEPIMKADNNNNPELANTLRRDLELQGQRNKLLKEISQADDDQLPELHKQLREVVAARFDIIIHKKQLYYDQLRGRLERIKQKIEEQAKELEKLKAEKDQSVEKRMKELTEGVESLDW